MNINSYVKIAAEEQDKFFVALDNFLKDNTIKFDYEYEED